MKKSADVLERSVIQTGKPFIRAGEENARAYLIQSGEVQSYIEKNDEKIIVSHYGPGTIIAETCLMFEQPMNLNYEAISTATVVTITRQDFQKRLTRIDKTVHKVLDFAFRKIEDFEREKSARVLNRSEVDETAWLLVENLVHGLSESKKKQYRSAMLPHLDGLIKGIKALKAEKNSTAS